MVDVTLMNVLESTVPKGIVWLAINYVLEYNKIQFIDKTFGILLMALFSSGLLPLKTSILHKRIPVLNNLSKEDMLISRIFSFFHTKFSTLSKTTSST